MRHTKWSSWAQRDGISTISIPYSVRTNATKSSRLPQHKFQTLKSGSILLNWQESSIQTVFHLSGIGTAAPYKELSADEVISRTQMFHLTTWWAKQHSWWLAALILIAGAHPRCSKVQYRSLPWSQCARIRKEPDFAQGMSITPRSREKVVAVRHPMPYGDLGETKSAALLFVGGFEERWLHGEEMEEYEPHIVNGTIIYAGVDYEAILHAAEKEADVIVWTAGNRWYVILWNRSHHRGGWSASSGTWDIVLYPGAVNIYLADVVVINKIDTASRENIDIVRKNIVTSIRKAIYHRSLHSPITVDDETVIRNKRVLVVEDGPTLTHGEMTYGAGVVAARKYEAKEIGRSELGSLIPVQETSRISHIGYIIAGNGNYGGKQIYGSRNDNQYVDVIQSHRYSDDLRRI